MANQSERVRVMKENFMTHWEQGWGVYEVAENYNLAPTTVYHYLQEIADANDVSCESLLQRPRALLTVKQYREEAKRTRISVEELRKDFKEIGGLLDSLIEKLDRILEEEEECRQDW